MFCPPPSPLLLSLSSFHNILHLCHVLFGDCFWQQRRHERSDKGWNAKRSAPRHGGMDWDGEQTGGRGREIKRVEGIKDSNCEMETDKKLWWQKKEKELRKASRLFYFQKKFKDTFHAWRRLPGLQTSHPELFVLYVLICHSLTKGHIDTASWCYHWRLRDALTCFPFCYISSFRASFISIVTPKTLSLFGCSDLFMRKRMKIDINSWYKMRP